jgi:hypothetical protein
MLDLSVPVFGVAVTMTSLLHFFFWNSGLILVPDKSHYEIIKWLGGLETVLERIQDNNRSNGIVRSDRVAR